MPLPIGFFSPLPLPVMIPFMAMQSFAMMYAAGTGWQYGKRKISSLTNETFNKITPVQLNAEVLGSIHEMIPSFEQSAQQMSEMNKVIFEQMRLMISDATNFFGELVFGMFSGIAKNAEDFFTGDTEPAPSNTGLTLISDTGQTSIYNPPSKSNLPSHEERERFHQEVVLANDLHIKNLVKTQSQQPQWKIDEIQTQVKLRGLDKPQFIPVAKDTSAADFKIKINQKLAALATAENRLRQASTRKRKSNQNLSLFQQQRQKDVREYKSEVLDLKKQLTVMSNRFRDPNNDIRKQALALRKIL